MTVLFAPGVRAGLNVGNVAVLLSDGVAVLFVVVVLSEGAVVLSGDGMASVRDAVRLKAFAIASGTPGDGAGRDAVG